MRVAGAMHDVPTFYGSPTPSTGFVPGPSPQHQPQQQQMQQQQPQQIHRQRSIHGHSPRNMTCTQQQIQRSSHDEIDMSIDDHLFPPPLGSPNAWMHHQQQQQRAQQQQQLHRQQQQRAQQHQLQRSQHQHQANGNSTNGVLQQAVHNTQQQQQQQQQHQQHVQQQQQYRFPQEVGMLGGTVNAKDPYVVPEKMPHVMHPMHQQQQVIVNNSPLRFTDVTGSSSDTSSSSCSPSTSENQHIQNRHTSTAVSESPLDVVNSMINSAQTQLKTVVVQALVQAPGFRRAPTRVSSVQENGANVTPLSEPIDPGYAGLPHIAGTPMHLIADPYIRASLDNGSLQQQQNTPAPVSSTRRSRSSHDGMLKCHFCPKKWSDETTLLRHMSDCRLIRVHECSHCGKRFKARGGLQQHLRIHSNDRPYQCQFCAKRFTQKSHVDQHERIHTGAKPFSCKVCGRAFRQRSQQMGHENTHNQHNGTTHSNSQEDRQTQSMLLGGTAPTMVGQNAHQQQQAQQTNGNHNGVLQQTAHTTQQHALSNQHQSQQNSNAQQQNGQQQHVPQHLQDGQQQLSLSSPPAPPNLNELLGGLNTSFFLGNMQNMQMPMSGMGCPPQTTSYNGTSMLGIINSMQ